MGVRNLLNRYVGAPEQRRRAWSKHLDRQARRHDLLTYPYHLAWSLPGELKELASEWGELPGLALDACQLLFSVARSTQQRGLVGDTAECGVRYGKSSFFILHGLRDPTRPHHLCDSFAGLSKPDAVDIESYARPHGWRRGDLAVNEAVARDCLKAFPQCQFHCGWIPDCFAGLEDKRFALVHVDVDLYAPTLAAFEFFYPRVVPGGIIVCDDYGFASCPGARRAVDQFLRGRNDLFIELPSGQALLVRS